MPSSTTIYRSNEQDLYRILGIQRTATLEDVKRAYKKLALRWHPDKNPDSKEEAEKKFKEINAAYDILSTESKRSMYDKYGMDGLRMQSSGSHTNAASSGGDFSTMFTGRSSPGGLFGRNFGFKTDSPFDFVFRDPFEIFREFFGSQSPFDIDSLFNHHDHLFDSHLLSPSRSSRRRQRNSTQGVLEDNEVDFLNSSNSNRSLSRKHSNRHNRHNQLDMFGLSNIGGGPIMGFGQGGGLFGNLLGFPSDGPFASLFGSDFGNFGGFSSISTSNRSGGFSPMVKSSVQTEIRNGRIITRTRNEQNGQVIETLEEDGILTSKTVDGRPVSLPADRERYPQIKVSVDGRAKRRRK
ncbi:hypothetical protein GJ496_004264 [Pomphorhynchus laevis]|nr:hypothetical protein GJ496_004264 [Pomphorhynchus laevis]